jgi:Tfp pilus assembly protein PilN
MRPVNLIPPEDRHGSLSPLRTGPLPYIVVGALVALLAGVALLVMAGSEISEKKDEITTLKQRDAAAQQQAQELAPYVQFAELHQARVETVSSLADSRFDWERVMRELSKILPSNVWLTSLDASASPESATAGGGSSEASGDSSLRGSIAGPALEISGCSTGQKGVAGFAAALKQIDGVTRVGVESSALPPLTGGEAGGGGGGDDCRTRKFIAQFQLVVAFDAAPVPLAAEAPTEVSAEAPPAEGEATTESSSTEESSSTSEG